MTITCVTMRAIDKKVNTMVAERAQYAANEKTHANRKNICLTTHVLQILTTRLNTEIHCKFSQHNQIQKRAANTHRPIRYA